MIATSSNTAAFFKTVLGSAYDKSAKNCRIGADANGFLYAGEVTRPCVMATANISSIGMSSENELPCRMHKQNFDYSRGTDLVVVLNVLV